MNYCDELKRVEKLYIAHGNKDNVSKTLIKTTKEEQIEFGVGQTVTLQKLTQKLFQTKATGIKLVNILKTNSNRELVTENEKQQQEVALIKERFQDIPALKEFVTGKTDKELLSKKEIYAQLELLATPAVSSQTLSQFSLERLGETHALDSGELRNLFNNYLKYCYGSDDLENHNILDNRLHVTVMTRGVFKSYDDDAVISLSILDVKKYPLNSLKSVWVFENINTMNRVIDSGEHFPVIIGSGRPNQAVFQLIERLINLNVTVNYHGDIDYAGLSIADSIVSKCPEVKTPLMTIETMITQQGSHKLNHQDKYLGQYYTSLANYIERRDKVVMEEEIPIKAFKEYLE